METFPSTGTGVAGIDFHVFCRDPMLNRAMQENEPEQEHVGLEHGAQPLDALMIELGIENHFLVCSSTDQLTHKVVSKARRGRELTHRAQRKIHAAMERALRQKGIERKLSLSDLFNYRGR
ncbi:MAG: hypothetical protein WBE58_14685 [Verrucomicrobiales bacterium]|nr:hypothetical protein [Verrucomicrobiales bacterium]